MIQKMNDNPELRSTGTFEHCLKKFNGDVESAQKFYDEMNRKKS